MREILRAAFVIARRDFTAIIFSKSFILFLIGPLLPVVFGVAFGTIGDRMANDSMRPVVAVALSAAESKALDAAHRRLDARGVPDLRRYPASSYPQALLAGKGQGVIAVLSGTLARPVLTGRRGDVDQMRGDLSLLISVARAGTTLPDTRIATRIVAESTGSDRQSRLLTGRAAQVILFMLTMLLAGMVLSNMVEEKTNKIIEVLAAAVPVDAIFLGKLLAMLAMSFVGIAVWATTALVGYLLLFGSTVHSPEPAVGWPMFVMLGVLYFTMAYTLLGSLFIGIGAQASTVREVQTISMPITMGQVLIFFFASFSVDRMGQTPEVIAAIFPFSSPFAMIARAAQSDALLPHVLALCWQALWVAVIIRIGVRLFRRNVLKSGTGEKRRGIFSRALVSIGLSRT
ncbi:ABC transporter permease [Sphingobium sp. SCG-1]|uniref:ABC transporter permease n=1 Tax=Sphingobium sp. SCG-1 TaxID=2072936 RepID=UPI000CD6B25A|nr:ABC transporter permease [Sphingobium sp. SCG-1]AUW57241.1 ABC transporter permease [Sphingobium sp. SCG-1]